MFDHAEPLTFNCYCEILQQIFDYQKHLFPQNMYWWYVSTIVVYATKIQTQNGKNNSTPKILSLVCKLPFLLSVVNLNSCVANPCCIENNCRYVSPVHILWKWMFLIFKYLLQNFTVIFCLYSSSKISRQKFEFSKKVKVIGSNPV